MDSKARIIITYCPKCNWMLRSTWMGQEILNTFSDQIEMLSLKPSDIPGEFNIKIGEKIIWERKADGGFPDVKTLKQLVRDEIEPDRSLGHLDK